MKKRVTLMFAGLVLMHLSTAGDSAGQGPGARSVQPGAPWQPSQLLEPVDPVTAPRTPYTEADVRFMQGMIEHHGQALEMTRLVPTRTAREDIRLFALRIDISQVDEIRQMQRWLAQKGEMVPEIDFETGRPLHAGAVTRPMDHRGPMDHGGHGAHGARGDHVGHGAHADEPAHHDQMAGHDHPMVHGAHGTGGADPHQAPHHGMLTREEMAQLAAASGAEFDRLFLYFMIRHHGGAIVMVEELFDSPGAGQESDIFEIASHIDSDQRIEIERMRNMF